MSTMCVGLYHTNECVGTTQTPQSLPKQSPADSPRIASQDAGVQGGGLDEACGDAVAYLPKHQRVEGLGTTLAYIQPRRLTPACNGATTLASAGGSNKHAHQPPCRVLLKRAKPTTAHFWYVNLNSCTGGPQWTCLWAILPGSTNGLPSRLSTYALKSPSMPS